MDFGDKSPKVTSPVFLAPGSYVIGAVELGKQASVWFNAVIRADTERIRLGERSNLQDHGMLHADAGFPCFIGDEVTIGHGAIIHGAQIDHHVLIGMGAIILNGARIHSDVIVGAGALITENMEIPEGSLVLGQPARVVRELSDRERQKIRLSAQHYVDLWIEQGWHFQ